MTRPPPAASSAWAWGSILAAVAAVYGWGLWAPFVAGDIPAIVTNATLRGGLRAAFSHPPETLSAVLGRPVLNLSFAANYAAGSLKVWGYHAVNGVIHLLNALLLFGIIRRTQEQSERFAWGCALLWAVHPLQTEAVTHLAQRAESLMTLALFFALYAFIRGAQLQRGTEADRGWSRAWFSGSVVACLAGMGTHEDMVSAPFILMLYDRTFLSPNWKAVLRARGGWQIAFLATLVWAGWLAHRYHSRDHTYGFGVVPWLTYAGAAYPAFAHYLRLTVWPHPLVLGYGNHYIASGWELLPGAGWFTLFTALALSTFYRPTAVSFLAVALLELLEPTSVVPHLHETLAEHRMYPTLAPLMIGMVWAGLSVIRWARRPKAGYLAVLRSGVTIEARERRGFAIVVIGLAIALGSVSAARNWVYWREPARLGGH